ncbi:hypothetical protein Pyn_38458 [Prunus yedoensis var. nudiflora]|uniref:Uncharacterized protein n=1 Tax=Prunus yedoensis var. nudiflora TaxID=2094558 RepID=A0A315A071_PRUYE|nr:hypothetical protein Pyn_38458 [Prunus yedoensis var. nudiflora]
MSETYQRQRSVEPAGKTARSCEPASFAPPPQASPWELGPQSRMGPRWKPRPLFQPREGTSP